MTKRTAALWMAIAGVGFTLLFYASRGKTKEGLIILISPTFEPIQVTKTFKEQVFRAGYIGTFLTTEKEAYKRRAITVFSIRFNEARALTNEALRGPTILVGLGIPEKWTPQQLSLWDKSLTAWASATVLPIRYNPSWFKWTIFLVSPEQRGRPATMIVTNDFHPNRIYQWAAARQRKGEVLVSLRPTRKEPAAFWISLLALGLIFLSGHWLLTAFWQWWDSKKQKVLLVDERGIYHSLAAVFFAFYLTSCAVLFQRPDFQDSVFIPPHPSPQPLPWGTATPLVGWLVNTLALVASTMIPSLIIPPSGIVIGHMRGMVEQAWTTAPTVSLPYGTTLFQTFGTFFQAESTIVAMVYSALLTRAIISPQSFGEESYWGAYRKAAKTGPQIVFLVAGLTLPASVLLLLSRLL
ncbi:MAG: hypothetical protein NZ959_05170 [Armatimonadetes bacterium]|nr:hypothetical protein [Armatimonadota bacterium]MDW8122274.1 hypothetical protein [Armatimonadota bacterium]